MNVEKYRALFVDEATDHLVEMSRALTALEQRDAQTTADASIDTLFRMAHSIKGMAASLGYDSIAALAHRLEDWLEPLRRAGTLPDRHLPLLYEVIGVLEQMVVSVQDSDTPAEAREELLTELDRPVDLDAPAPKEGGLRKKDQRWRRPRCRALCAYAPRRSTAS